MGARLSAPELPPRGLTRGEYFRRWSDLHGGYDPRGSRWAQGWLSITYVVARPLANARVAPDVVTLLGAAVAFGVVGLVAADGRWLIAAAAVTALSALADSLDGAVAVLTDRATRWGAVLDSVVDRVSEGFFLLALWLGGAPGWACVVGGVLAFLHEYARARAGALGMDDIGVVTIWERPTRVVVTAMFLLGGGVHVGAADGWASAGAAAWVTLGAIGLVQLLVVVRRRLAPAARS